MSGKAGREPDSIARTLHDSLRVLVVDDEDSVRMLLVRVLQRYGLPVAQASDVQTALSLLERAPVRVVLTDRHMPGQSGLELLAWIRAHMPQTRVLVMTGDHGAEGEEALALGAFACVSKPFDDVLALGDRVLQAATAD